MSCCGKTKAVLRKGKNIAVGYTNLARGKKYEFTDGRIRKCHKCDEQTWMSAAEYAVWLSKHGIKVVTNFTELEKLPKLPKQELGPKRQLLYCRICKCFVPTKAG